MLEIIEMSLCVCLFAPIIITKKKFCSWFLGHCSVFTCHLREFFFIEDERSWHDAQEHCRQNYNDLLTVYDKEDVDNILKYKIQKDTILKDKMQDKDAWIGLRRESADGGWQWSQPGVTKEFKKWAHREPSDRHNKENCAIIRPDGLNDASCSREFTFLCYNGEDCYSVSAHPRESTCAYFDHFFSFFFFQSFQDQTRSFFLFTSSQSFSPASTDTTKKAELVEEKKNWWDALEHCRRFHTDLASGPDQLDLTHTAFHWTGYFKDNWRWSDGSDSLFRNWESDVTPKKHCALLHKSGLWKPKPCDEEKASICYKGARLH